MRDALVVRRATLDEILALRHAELRPGLARTTAEFDGDAEATTRHVGAFRGADVVGCASWMSRPWQGVPAYQLRGMATRADLVRHGVGTAVLQAGECLITDETGGRLLWCNARVAAVGFYRRLGWEIASAVFDVPTVGPHHAMVRRR